MVILAASLAVLGAGAGWLLRGSPAPQTAAAKEGTKVESVLHLETFVINLAGADERAFLRVGIDLGLSHPPGHAEDSVSTAMVRDVVLSVLTQRQPDDLLTAEGKTKLKNDLLQALQQRAPGLGAKQVYFTEFLIQR
jgi:flagellar FliL protein